MSGGPKFFGLECRPLIKAAKNKQVLYGLAYGSSQAIVFFAYAGCFHFGAFLIEKNLLPPERFNDIYRVLMAIVFGAMAVGQSSGEINCDLFN